MSEVKNRSIKALVALVILFFVIFMIFAGYTLQIFNQDEETAKNVSSSTEIKVVEVEGVIMDPRTTIKKLHIAEKDKDTKAIILRVDSPGGAVGPTQEIYDEIIRIDKKIPVYASFGSIAASGGYYIGSACRRIYANAGTLTGSIGVIMEFAELKQLFEFAKIKPYVIKAGKYKDIGSPNREMTQEETDLMNNVIGGVHQQFMDDIMKRRGKVIKGNIIDLAQGQIYSGMQAKDLGLVDRIGGMWVAGREIHSELKLKKEFGLKFIDLKKKNSFFDLLEGAEGIVENLKMVTKVKDSPMMMFK